MALIKYNYFRFENSKFSNRLPEPMTITKAKSWAKSWAKEKLNLDRLPRNVEFH